MIETVQIAPPAPPEPSDPTRLALRFVRERQQAHRAEARRGGAGNAIYLGYVLVLIFGIYVGPYTVALARLSGPHRGTSVAGSMAAALPTALPTLLLGVYLLIARDALWRGPVAPAAAPAEWLLPTPLSRRLLLGRSYTAALVISSLGLAGLGLFVAVAIYACGVGTLTSLLVAGFATGALTGATATGIALAVQRWGRPDRISAGWTFAAVLLLVAGTVASAFAASSGHRGPLAAVLPWLGPWGWSSQLVFAAAGLHSPGWPPAALLAGCCALAALIARRQAHTVDANELRRRSRAVAQVVSAVATINFRQARLSRQPASGATSRRFRLTVLRSVRMTIPRRDAEALIRFPSRIGTTALAAAAAAGLLNWAASAVSSAQIVLILISWIAFYLAAAQLVETARLESDDPARSDPLGPGFGAVAAAHAVVPMLVLTTIGALAAGVATAATAHGTVFWLLPLAAPITVVAALISAYRGPLPFGLLLGAQTPLGNTGVIQVAVWYLRGALTMLVLVIPLTLWVIRTADPISALFTAGPLVLIFGNAGLTWVRSLATKQRRKA